MDVDAAFRDSIRILVDQQNGLSRSGASIGHAERIRAEKVFVTWAKRWADSHGVTPQAFVAEGLPKELLRRAGFSIPPERADGSQEVEPIGDADLELLLPRHRPFTVAGLVARWNYPEGVIQQTIERAVESGTVKAVAVSTVEGTSQRNAVLYRRA